MRHRTPPALALAVALGLALAACGGDDETTDAPADTAAEEVAEPDADADEEPTTDDEPAEEEPAEEQPQELAGGEADYGTVTLGDEVIALDDGFGCFDEEQEVVGSDGLILLQVRVSGTNAAGEEVVFDLTRYDEDSLFTGDDLILDLGELDFDTGDLSVGSYTAKLDLGAAGELPTLSASGFTWSSETLGEAAGAFEITC